jgi:hypothetical protein
MSSTTVLALNSAESGMERMKVNASKALLVDGSAVTQPVSGTFYQATQPISAASALLVDGSATTQPVSGTFFQATQPISAASALLVDGSATTQPISGAVSVSGSVVVDGSGVTQPVSGTFFQATQPISAASALLVDGSAITQPVSGTVSISGNVNTVGGALSVANNSLWSSETILNGNTEVTTGLDISLYRSLVIYGDTDNLSGEIMVQVSFDNTNYYDLGLNLFPDATSGNFVRQLESDAKYIRVSKTNNSGVSESISANIMIKSG